jgi:hypothetical protein
MAHGVEEESQAAPLNLLQLKLRQILSEYNKRQNTKWKRVNQKSNN